MIEYFFILPSESKLKCGKCKTIKILKPYFYFVILKQIPHVKFHKIFLLFFIFLAAASVKAQQIPLWKINDLQSYIKNADSVLVINFWATYCKPCLEEIPYYQAIINKHKDQKVKLLLLDLDTKEIYPAKIENFVKERNYSSQVVWLNENNINYYCPKVDKSWMGGIPSTLFINNKTGYKKFFEQQLKPEKFEIELKNAIGNKTD